MHLAMLRACRKQMLGDAIGSGSGRGKGKQNQRARLTYPPLTKNVLELVTVTNAREPPDEKPN